VNIWIEKLQITPITQVRQEPKTEHRSSSSVFEKDERVIFLYLDRKKGNFLIVMNWIIHNDPDIKTIFDEVFSHHS
jgi:hypothetical protein